jgi:Fe-S-cluster-containing hydrogenase component 2
MNFKVDSEKCKKCDFCLEDCPRGIITKKDNEPPFIRPGLEDNCLECQHCLAICPTGAISIFNHDPAAQNILNKDTLPSLKQMATFIRGRRSVRRYKKDNVPTILINKLLSCLANAPTGCNDRDLTFILIDNITTMQNITAKTVKTLEEKINQGTTVPDFLKEGITAYRKDGNDQFFRNAPHLLIVSAGEKATCPTEDIVLTLAYFELLAQSAGLGTLWCGYLTFILEAVPELKPTFGLNTSQKYFGLLFGYPMRKYSRTVNRDTAAKIVRLNIS